jgi:hypothetical protein
MGHPPRHDLSNARIWMMAGYTAYFDDSGHPDDQDVVLVAGWLAMEDQWLRFEGEWRQALMDAGIPLEIGFHMTDFESPFCKLYKDWSVLEKEGFLYKLINLLRTRAEMFFSALIPMYEYRKVNEHITLEEVIGRPYGIAGRIIMAYLNEWRKKYNKQSDPLVVVFEDGSKHKGDLIDIFHRDGFDPPAFRDKKKVVPLQGADLLAWEYFNAFHAGELRPSLLYILRHPGIDGMFTQDDLVEACQLAKAPSRDFVHTYGTRIFFETQKKKDRIRKIIGPPSEESIKGEDRRAMRALDKQSV